MIAWLIGLSTQEMLPEVVWAAEAVRSDVSVFAANRPEKYRQFVSGSSMMVFLRMFSDTEFRLPTNYHEVVQMNIVDADGRLVAKPLDSRRYPGDKYTNIVDGMYVTKSASVDFRFGCVTNMDGHGTNDYRLIWDLPGITSGHEDVEVVCASDSNDVWRVRLAGASANMLFDRDYANALEVIREAKAVVGPLFRMSSSTVDENEAECLYGLGRWQEALDAYKIIYESQKKDPGDYGPSVPARIQDLEEKLNITPRTPVYQ